MSVEVTILGRALDREDSNERGGGEILWRFQEIWQVVVLVCPGRCGH